ncbi:MAG TPA: hypothetical protein VG247_00885 [Pseudonocardiaceae bacterium]|jgi:hypothetical protein|nr:hypothetical protein [Pseudonocardiaceae bacterium]
MARGRGKGKQRKQGSRSAQRESVTADPNYRDGGDGPDGDGTAGVREPRRPKPLGPMSSAGERPMPPPEFAVSLPDPRY